MKSHFTSRMTVFLLKPCCVNVSLTFTDLNLRFATVQKEQNKTAHSVKMFVGSDKFLCVINRTGNIRSHSGNNNICLQGFQRKSEFFFQTQYLWNKHQCEVSYVAYRKQLGYSCRFWKREKRVIGNCVLPPPEIKQRLWESKGT